MKLTKEITTQADIKIKYLSPEFNAMSQFIRKIAKVNIEMYGFYTFTKQQNNKTIKILIIN